MNAYFDEKTPTTLQHQVWFYLTYYFGLRGRETLPQLNKDSIAFAVDSEGQDFAFLNHNVLSKNVKASLNLKDYSDPKEYKMYSNKDDLKSCPVNAIKTYLSKIPESNNSLFPIPIKNWQRSKFWYCDKKGLEKDSKGLFMKTISKEASLSQLYTNHCVRVTTISELKCQGYSNEDICLVTGHKNPASVSRYVRQRTDSQKRKVSESLQLGFCNKVAVAQNVNGNCQTISIMEPREGTMTINFSGSFTNCTFHTKTDKN